MLDLARQQDVPLTGLYGSSELQALAAGQPTTPAGAMCRRACCRAARWSIPRRGYARAIRKAAPCCRRDSRANGNPFAQSDAGLPGQSRSHRPRVHGRRLLQDRRPGLCLERAAVRVPGAHGRLAAAGGLPGQSGRDRAGGRVAARRARLPGGGRDARGQDRALRLRAAATGRAGRRRGLDRRLQGRDGGLQGARRLHRAGCLPVH